MKNDDLERKKREKEAHIEETEGLLNRAAQKDWSLPETDLLNRVASAFQRKKARQPKRPSLPATLQFDNWTQSAALGIRGNGLRERQLLFSEGSFDLDLQIVEDPTTHMVVIRGQLLPMDESEKSPALQGIELHLMNDQSIHSRRITDEYGRFHFSNCTPGDYSLRVILDDHDIILKSLTVKA
jgi:hypothetical protein